MRNFIYYTDNDHETWKIFYSKHYNFACKNSDILFQEGMTTLIFDTDKIPDIVDISNRIKNHTDFTLVLVDRLLSPLDFFKLLMQRKFPVSISIRPADQIDFYASENPDIIHELFGHCPFLVNHQFAEYTFKLGKIAYNKILQNHNYSKYFERLYWHTIEFGVIKINNKFKAYGAGIIPSRQELLNVSDPNSIKKPFDLRSIIETDYSVLAKQNCYFYINNINELYNLDFNEFDNLIQSIEYSPRSS